MTHHFNTIFTQSDNFVFKQICAIAYQDGPYAVAGVAQLGEQQTEVLRFLEVPCSIHGPGTLFFTNFWAATFRQFFTGFDWSTSHRAFFEFAMYVQMQFINNRIKWHK